MPTIQTADLWRQSGRYDAYGPEMLRLKDRHDREMLYGPTNEEMVTEIFRAYVALLPRPAAQPLPHPVEVPGRGAPALRRDARPRVPDEGRLLLRPRPRGRAGELPAHVRGLSPHLRAHGAEGDPDAGRHRADRRRHEPRVRGPRGDRREPSLPAPRPARLRRARRRAGLRRRPFRRGGLLDRPLRRDRRGARRGGLGRDPGGAARLGPRHRGRPHLLFRHQVQRLDGPQAARPGRRPGASGDGQLRHRRLAPGRRADRGQPRRGRHTLARSRRALRRRGAEPEAGRRGLRRAVRAAARAPSRRIASTTTAPSAPASNSPMPT